MTFHQQQPPLPLFHHSQLQQLKHHWHIMMLQLLLRLQIPY
jgi:hypothetical protein